MTEKEDVSPILLSVLLELQAGNFSIFKKHRKKDVEKILALDCSSVPVEFPNLIIKRLVEKKGKNCPLSLVFFCIDRKSVV